MEIRYDRFIERQDAEELANLATARGIDVELIEAARVNAPQTRGKFTVADVVAALTAAENGD